MPDQDDPHGNRVEEALPGVTQDPYDLALPGEVLEVRDDFAMVRFRGGLVQGVNVSFVNVQAGDLVLVHAGYAIQKIDREEARRTLEWAHKWGSVGS